jgi:GT2 family glycosyltransferase
MKELSIVIVAWNCKTFIKECLDSLASYRRDPTTEIVVVDNASVDGTYQLVRECYPEVVLVQSNENLGFPRGTNLGIRNSSGRYLCLINPDVRVLDGCIQKMTAYMDSNPEVGLLGPRMLDSNGVPGRSYMGAPTLWNLLCRALSLDMLFPGSKLFSSFLMFYFDRSRTTEVDVLNGWFWMTRRRALEEVGVLDESLFMYADDLDWSKRFRDANWKVVYLPEAESIHYGGGTTARAPIRFAVEMQRANFQYWKKNYGRAFQVAYLAIISLHQIVRLAGYFIVWTCIKANRDDAAFKMKRSLASLQWILGIGPYGRITAQTRIQAEISSS